MAQPKDLAKLPKRTPKDTEHTLFVKVPKALYLAYKSEVHTQEKTVKDDFISHMEQIVRDGPTWRATLQGLGATDPKGLAGRPVNV